LNLAEKEKCEFVCWFLLRDYDAVIPYFSGQPILQEQLKAWEFAGFMDADGTEREAYRTWKSWFALPVSNPIPAALDTVIAYPNPFRTGANSVIYFTNLTPNASLTVYTVSGEKIRELAATSVGLASWMRRIHRAILFLQVYTSF